MLDQMTAPAPSTPRPKKVRPKVTASGILGELLLTAAVVAGSFLVWQMLWTDVTGVRESAAEIEAMSARPEFVEPPQQMVAPSMTTEPPAVGALGGDTAILHVPRWGADYERIIGQGTSRDVLNRIGVGHYSSTQGVGEVGNFGLAGHRTGYGSPFRGVEELEVGDAIVVETDAYWFVYKMTETEIVRPSQGDVLLPVPGDPEAEPTRRLITLTTCHPLWQVKQRFIVYGELAYWADKSLGIPEALAGGN